MLKAKELPAEPEGSSLVEDEKIESAPKEEPAKGQAGIQTNIQQDKDVDQDLDKTKGKKYVVYANINS